MAGKDSECGAAPQRMTPSEINAMVAEAIRVTLPDALAAALRQHQCRLDISDDAAEEVSHVMGMLKDVGSGDYARGIESVRENHKWLRNLREKSNKLTMAAILMILAALVTGSVAALWQGIKFAIVAPIKH